MSHLTMMTSMPSAAPPAVAGMVPGARAAALRDRAGRAARRLAGRWTALVALSGAAAWTVWTVFAPSDWHEAVTFLAWGALLPVAAGVAAMLWTRLPRVRTLRAAGSSVLHASVLLLAAGVLWNRTSSFSLPLELIEGQTAALPGTPGTLRLDRYQRSLREGRWSKGDAALVTWLPGGRAAFARTVYANHPLEADGTRVYLDIHGFAPLLAVSDAATGRSFRGFVGLETALPPRVRYWKNLDEPGIPLRAHLAFRPAAQGPYPRDPRLTLIVPRADGGAPITGVLRPGETLQAGSAAVTFEGVRSWVRFTVCRDPGLGLIFTAFWVAVAGAAFALWPRVLA